MKRIIAFFARKSSSETDDAGRSFVLQPMAAGAGAGAIPKVISYLTEPRQRSRKSKSPGSPSTPPPDKA